MAVVRCNKCGADIPEGATFCPGCGAPRPQEMSQSEPTPPPAQPSEPPTQPTPPPAQPSKPVTQPMSQPVAPSGAGAKGFINSVFSKKMLTIGVGICLLIGWIARLIIQFLGRYDGFGDQTVGYTVMNILNFTFLAAAGAILMAAGFLYEKYNIYVRVGLIVAGSILIATNL